MLRRHAWTAAGLLLLGGGMALVPVAATAASASKHGVAALNCPKESVISKATGKTYKGPAKDNGGTAACIYTDAAGNSLNVISSAPGVSKSKWVSITPGDIEETGAGAVSGIGKAAFSTTTFGHAEVAVYQSNSKRFRRHARSGRQSGCGHAGRPGPRVKAVAHAHRQRLTLNQTTSVNSTLSTRRSSLPVSL